MSITGLIGNYYILVMALGLGALASALYHPLGSSVTIKLIKRAQGTSLSFFMTIGGFAASVSPLIAIHLWAKEPLVSFDTGRPGRFFYVPYKALRDGIYSGH